MFSRCQKDTSGMLALNRSGLFVEEFIAEHRFASDISVVCLNSPNDCVVSGPIPQLHALRETFMVSVGQGAKATLLDVPFGYHSRYMDPILDELRHVAETKVQWGAPQVAIASNVLGTLVEAGDDYSLLNVSGRGVSWAC